MLTKEQERILKEQAARTADKYIKRPIDAKTRENMELLERIRKAARDIEDEPV